MQERAKSSVLVSEKADVARVTLNRPERHNAFDDALIAELTATFERLSRASDVRAVVLAARGKSFSAGGDLRWMQRTAGYSLKQNHADARRLATLMHVLDTLPKPTVALVQGAAYGGGVGLVAACDIAIACQEASFCISEVKLGLIPAVISPYVLRAIGPRAARRYFLTAELFDAAEAHRLGLVHAVVPASELEAAGGKVTDSLLANGPRAVAAAKALIAEVAGRPVDAAMMDETARLIAEARSGEEGREGIAAFLEKRKPKWTKG